MASAHHPVRRRGYSLRRRLIATTVGSSIAVGLVSTAIVLAIAWSEVSEAFDHTLEESAGIVLALSEGALSSGQASHAGAHGNLARSLDYQIVAGGGVVLWRGDDAPAQPFVDPDRGDGFYDVRRHDTRWRVYVRHHDASGVSAQIGQEWDERSELISDSLESLAWPLIVLWSLLGLVNWWIIRKLMAPLERISRGIEGKSPADLSPMAHDGQAIELQLMVDALNRLLERLSRALESERRFTSDAAHELRTPLAALASRIQVVQRRHAGDTEGSSGLAADLQQLRHDVARSTALVENLLQLARLDPESPDALAMERFDLSPLLHEAARICAPAAAARGIAIQVECHACTVLGQPDWLLSALRNLVDNAIRYGREGGTVRVSAVQGGKGVELAVGDDGPGVDDASLGRLTQRFFRVLGSQAQGNGLGLSIVAQVAELHGATLAFGPGLDGRGLGVTLTFPSSGSGHGA
ncbi:ATP-binding protein [Pusillimonas noertemannii]|uniref:ATP-binding protein n=1 Tax=Pusillimonas noertemannii TaxID=305977 RepID=UPI000311B227|nr:ATP-binding protein [Pusillimonas noertemannii]